MRRLRSINERSSYVRVEFKHVYIAKGSFRSQSAKENQSKLDFVEDNLNKFVHASLSKESRNYISYCHCLLLESKLRILKKLCDTKPLSNNSTSLSTKFTFILEMYICQKLCIREKLVYLAEDNSIIKSCPSVGLVSKNSVLDENNKLAKCLNRSYFNRCNEYIKLVLNTEAIVYFVMVNDHINYVAACERLALSIGTFNYFKTKKDQP